MFVSHENKRKKTEEGKRELIEVGAFLFLFRRLGYSIMGVAVYSMYADVTPFVASSETLTLTFFLPWFPPGW